MQTRTTWQCDLCAAEGESMAVGVPAGWSSIMVGGTNFFPHHGHYCFDCTSKVVVLLRAVLKAVPAPQD